MTASASASARKTLTIGRLGTSPKTLHRKAMEKAAAAPAPEDGGIEALFPQAEADSTGSSPDGAARPLSDDASAEPAPAPTFAALTPDTPTLVIKESTAPSVPADQPVASPPSTHTADLVAPAAPSRPESPPSWSEADERAYQALLARRKAAGFQRRGRDVSAQMVAVGKITPNAGTVVAAIMSLVAERGPLSRGELIDLMATPAFSHPKGKGSDREWAVGYVGGAVRDGFLTVVPEGQPLGEPSPNAPAIAA